MRKISRNRVDCLFIFSPDGENANNYFFYHTGSAYIISFLRLHGYASEQFIYNDFINLETCVKKILRFNAKVIGLTVFNTNFITSILIAEQLKKISPETIIALGGPTATTYAEFILGKYPFIDVCFRNESEEIFLQFLNQLSYNHFDFRRSDFGQIMGISYRYEDKICKNPESNILVKNSKIKDYLDKYPSPYLSGVVPGPAAFNVGLLTARGCNQNCVYCNCAVLSRRRFFTHSVDRVISEIDFISRYSDSNQTLNFFDDAFSLIPQRAKRICKAIIENKIKISLSCMTRCDCIDEELLDLMKEAGFVSLGISLESANPKTLRIIGKVHKAEDNPSDELEKEVLFIEKLGVVSAYAKKIGIKNVFSSIMSGLPCETIEEANRTIETIDKYVDIDTYSHNFLNIYQGTPLFSTYPKYGYKVEFINDNPIFSRTIYPNEIAKKVNVSSKSHIHRTEKINRNKTLKILSLVPEKNSADGWFNNIILLSDTFDRHFVNWLKKIFAINGTIIQIYSNKDALLNYSENNYDQFIRYSTPSLNILNYYIERNDNLLLLNSYSSSILNIENKEGSISICDFNFVRKNLKNPEIDFLKILCKESDIDDAISAHDYFSMAKKKKNLFSYLINKRAFPYFANLCKWTKDFSNCQKRNTLIINDKSEIKLCWYGRKIGEVGQSFTELLKNFELYQNKISNQRKCSRCIAKDYCNKCINPFPVSDEEYCIRQNMNDITEVSELFISFDVFKQYM
jgi:anaerobic magnesium-protoporphyrin IX monomethyl ester cyclase